MNQVLILIPARFGSTRFPAKPLAKIAGQTMIERVYNNCAGSGFKTVVVTDHDLIEAEITRIKGEVVRINDDVPSGSERIALAYERFFKSLNPKIIMNVQGDEPLLRGDVLKELAKFHLNSSFHLATLLRPKLTLDPEFKNPNVVKAIWSDVTKQCLYFSRESIPHSRDHLKSYEWYQHIGVYSFKPESLLNFVKLNASTLENLEKLEQLRALENGFTIGGVLTHQKLIGVDVPEDIIKVEGALNENS